MSRNLELELIEKISASLSKSIGGSGCGSLLIDDTDAAAGAFYCVVPQENTEFDVSGCATDITGFPTGVNDFVVGAGVPLFGNWTSIQLTSGSVIAYKIC
tara:strand:+ start:430 stop:729 length:300 start_codon:yes stop_codon:yes gene_type:complete